MKTYVLTFEDRPKAISTDVNALKNYANTFNDVDLVWDATPFPNGDTVYKVRSWMIAPVKVL